jgi:cytoskeletal protein CcmA (bactofilin family)
MFKRRGNGKAGRIDTLIGKGVRIQGDLEFEGGLHLDGSVEGSVWALLTSDATLSVGDHGQIEGSLSAPDVVLNGSVRGDIVASGSVVLGPRARVHGNVVYGSIEIAAGAEVQGRLLPQSAGAVDLAPNPDGAGGDQWSRVAAGSP